MARGALNVEALGKSLAKILDNLVIESGESGRTVSARVNITRARFAQILSGERPPTVDELDRIAEYFQTKASVIVRQAEESLSPLATVTDLSDRSLRVIEERSAALDPGYPPEDEQDPNTP